MTSFPSPLSALLLSTVMLLALGCKPGKQDARAEGFGTRPASLEGTYGIKSGAVIEPVLKVEASKAGGYVFEERTTGEWASDPEPAHTATTQDFIRSFNGTIDAPVSGLATMKATIYKVPEGWSRGTFRTTTGYILITPTGPVELTKILRN